MTVSVPDAPSASAEPQPPREPKQRPTGHTYADCLVELRQATELAHEGGFAEYQDAMTAEHAGKIDEARKLWLKLIQNSPKSTLVPFAYFGFGVHFQREATAGDPAKWAFAEQSYREVTKYPNTRLLVAAQLELGRSAAAKGDDQGALAAYMSAIEASRSHDHVCGPEIVEATKPDVVNCFAKVGDPKKASVFLGRLYGADADRVVVRLAEVLLERSDREGAANAILPLLEKGVRPKEICDVLTPDPKLRSKAIAAAIDACRD